MQRWMKRVSLKTTLTLSGEGVWVDVWWEFNSIAYSFSPQQRSSMETTLRVVNHNRKCSRLETCRTKMSAAPLYETFHCNYSFNMASPSQRWSQMDISGSQVFFSLTFRLRFLSRNAILIFYCCTIHTRFNHCKVINENPTRNWSNKNLFNNIFLRIW